jgi:hypothetical protein
MKGNINMEDQNCMNCRNLDICTYSAEKPEEQLIRIDEIGYWCEHWEPEKEVTYIE